MLRWMTPLLVIALVFWISTMAWSQSCALCYTQAARSGTKFISGLRSGIVILILPPMFMSVGITWLAYKKRNQFREDLESGDEQNIEQ